ncbi:hypothetical protein ACM55K_13360 [Flavobacterium sp. LT1R49]|uniref:hypothetical protein n=1 Tax=Flavobacterium arabinosi TaxID=3398737 RepID=UPI003A88EAAA
MLFLYDKTALKLYIKYGFYKEYLISITKKGKEGLAEINWIMIGLREKKFKVIDGQKVIRIEDYKLSISKQILTHEE